MRGAREPKVRVSVGQASRSRKGDARPIVWPINLRAIMVRLSKVSVAVLSCGLASALLGTSPSKLGGGVRRVEGLRALRSSTGQTEVRMSATLPGLRRVVVTGMGICSCLGNSLDEVADSLYHAKSGIKFMPKYAELGMKSQVAGRPSLDLDKGEEVKVIDRKSARFMGENAKYAYIAMNDAIKDAELPAECYENNPRAGGILGQGGTSILDIAETLNAVSAAKLRRVGP